MKWLDASEICCGLVLTGKMSAEYIIPTYLCPPYDIIISKVREGKTTAQVLDMVGLLPVTAARDAASTISFTDTTIEEMLTALMNAYRREEQSRVLEKQLKMLKNGDDLDTSAVVSMLEKTEEYTGKYTLLSDIDESSPIWRKTYYPPIDKYLGDPEDGSMVGVPEGGLTIIAGPPGCLVGDTLVKYNRGGITRTCTLEHLYTGFTGGRNGSGRAWRSDIDTLLQSRQDDGTIRLNVLDAIVCSGEKEAYKLTLVDGKYVTGTADHPILTEQGWKGIGDLNPGDTVYAHVGRNSRGRTKPNYLTHEGLKFHPYCGRNSQKRFTVSVHRLVVEASMNGISTKELVSRCKTGNVAGLRFLSRSTAVHHEDGDTYNNALENLKILTVKAHHALHAKETYRNVLENTGLVEVQSVEHVGIRNTYDVYMRDDPHNFIANGIVVHNTGKTSLMAKIIAPMAKNMKKSLVYSLEMLNGQIGKRIIQASVSGLTDEQKKQVVICDEIMSVDEVYADAMRLCATMDIYAIFIDFSDMLVERDQDEQSMAYIYKRTAALAKKNKTGAPVFLLSQLNRNYTGGIPKINHLRYTGLAEAMGALILLVYNPNQIFAQQGASDSSLPVIPGRGYLIVGKSRYGFREGGPGAIQIGFDGKSSWSDEAWGWSSLTSV